MSPDDLVGKLSLVAKVRPLPGRTFFTLHGSPRSSWQPWPSRTDPPASGDWISAEIA